MHEHSKRIKTYIYLISFLLLIGAIYYASFAITNNSAKLAQCRDLFDSKDLESKKRLCCDSSHYNSQDELCKAKCDTLGVSPDSSFCSEIAIKQLQPGVAREIPKQPIRGVTVPECKNIVISPNIERVGDQFVLKPGTPLDLSYNIFSPDLKARSYVLEFFSYEQGKDNFKAISFDLNKTYRAFYNATDTNRTNQIIEVSGLHEDLYKPDLNNNNKYPENVLMILSIIDEKKNKTLQGWNCFVRIKVAQTPNYCKSIETSDKEIAKGETAKVTITPNTPEVGSFDIRIINRENNKEISIEGSAVANAQPDNASNSRYQIRGNGSKPITLNIPWQNIYKEDKNTDNQIKNIRVVSYVRPKENIESEKLTSCSVDIKLKDSEGINMCDNMNLKMIKKDPTNGNLSNVSADSDGKYTLKENHYLEIELNAKQKDIKEFTFSFHNLDNIIQKDYGKGKGFTKDGIKNPYSINFKKGVDFEVYKKSSSNNDDEETIKIFYEDLDSIDLQTGSRPKNIQVRGMFRNNSDEISSLDSDCVKEFRVN